MTKEISDKNEGKTETSNLVEAPTAALNTLKSVATSLGIDFHPNIGLEKLQIRIEDHMKMQQATKAVEPAKAINPVTPVKTEEDTEAEKRRKIIMDATELVRVNITCMNPLKKEYQGEIFTVSNSIVPTLRKYVPFNTDKGWYIPRLMLNMIKERKCQLFRNKVLPNKQVIREGYLIPEFNVQILPPLTAEELQALKEEQAMTGRVG